MNTQLIKSRLFGIFVLSLLLIGFNACTSKYAFQTSSVAPAARGDVKVKKDGNKNYLIKVDIINLAEVKRLQPARQAYVVWMLGEEDVVKNMGQITSSSGMLSPKLKASFHTVSATKPRRIFITAEDDATVTTPGSMIILSTDKF